MICLDVWVNGKKICLAGVGESGNFSTIIYAGEKQGQRESNLFVGGLVNDEHVRWTKDGHPLEVGDEVTITIVEAEAADEPIEKYPRKKAQE